MLAKQVQPIEFLGGPLDGFVSKLDKPRKPFALVKSAPQSGHVPALSQLMRTFLFQGHPQPDIVAVYELVPDSGRSTYRYLRSIVATDREVSELIWVVDHPPC